MNKAALAIATILIAVGGTRIFAQTAPASQVSDPVISGLVKVADEIKLPAQEAGVLVQLSVREGFPVKKSDQIGKIDDREVVVQKKAAEAAYSGAYARYKEDIEIQFSKKQAEVDHADYQQMVESNQRAAKSITDTEVRGQKLKWDRSELAIQKAIHDQDVAKWEAFAKQAESEAADLKLRKSAVIAPFDGVVEEIKRHQDEWVQSGDTILTLLRMDVMRVEGAVEQSKYDPHEIANCAATVEVEMARGRKATFQGRIIKVSSVVRSDGVYNVRAEITNQQEHGNWLLRDGMPASMTIHLGTGTPGATGVSRAR